MALDAATMAFLQQMAESGAKPIHESTPEEVRALGEGLKDAYGEGPAVADVQHHHIEANGSFAVRVLKPHDPQGIFVYYHGGGWVIGALDEFDTLGRRLAVNTNCTVVLVDYRLAPEHRYPTAADDAYAALEWVAANRASLASEHAPIVIGGDSAGGNLTAVTALRARDRQGPEIALQVLVYPVTDADFERPSYLAEDNQLFLSRAGMIWFWDHYLPEPSQRSEPDATPLHAAKLEGLPPALVILAEHDVLYDEGKAYAERLRQAGVAVEMHEHAGQMHGFFTILMLAGSQAAHEQVYDAVKRHLAQAAVVHD